MRQIQPLISDGVTAAHPHITGFLQTAEWDSWLTQALWLTCFNCNNLKMAHLNSCTPPAPRHNSFPLLVISLCSCLLYNNNWRVLMTWCTWWLHSTAYRGFYSYLHPNGYLSSLCFLSFLKHLSSQCKSKKGKECVFVHVYLCACVAKTFFFICPWRICVWFVLMQIQK